MLTDMYRSRNSSQPSIIDRVDPVIWSKHGHCPMISVEDETFYEENGFLFLKNVFSDAEVAQLRREANHMQKSSPTDDEVISEPGSDEIRSVLRVHDKSGVFSRLRDWSRLPNIFWMMTFIFISHASISNRLSKVGNSSGTRTLKLGIPKMACRACAHFRCLSH